MYESHELFSSLSPQWYILTEVGLLKSNNWIMTLNVMIFDVGFPSVYVLLYWLMNKEAAWAYDRAGQS